ncbi:MAG: hypothetical protein K1X74_11325 [Pirellulales bacterium]|nr:hypothetical protein [Pirellulales bacterium]
MTIESLEYRQLLAVTASIEGPAAVSRGVDTVFTLRATDTSPPGQDQSFAWFIDWNGDTIVEEYVRGVGSAQVHHTFTGTGAQSIRVTAYNELAVGSPVVTHTVTIASYRVEVDASNSSLNNLIWLGTPGDDFVQFTRQSGRVTIIESRINGVTTNNRQSFNNINGYIFADAGAGDDIVSSNGLGVTATFFGGDGADQLFGGDVADYLDGGAGNDILVGGNGDDFLIGGLDHDVVVGQAGNDLLRGGDGRDLIIGGRGGDNLVGEKEADIVISGWTTYTDQGAADVVALIAMRNEWLSNRSYSERIANLSDEGTPTRNNGENYLRRGKEVMVDDAVDVVAGSAGNDWFLANAANRSENGVFLPADTISDRALREQLTDVEFLNVQPIASPNLIIRAWPTEAQALLDRIVAQGLQNNLPFSGLMVMMRHLETPDKDHELGPRAAAAAVKRALDLGIQAGVGLAFFPQEGEWTSVAGWAEWRNDIAALRDALDELGVTNDALIGLDLEDYPGVPNPGRPPDLPLDYATIDASSLGRAVRDSGFLAQLDTDFGGRLQISFPSGKSANFSEEIAVGMAMRVNTLADYNTFVLTDRLLLGEQPSASEWRTLVDNQLALAQQIGVTDLIGTKASILRPENAAIWQRFLELTGEPETVYVFLDDSNYLGEGW